MNAPIKILKAARKLLTKKQRWTKDTLARDKYGKPVLSYSSNAHSFCALGAIGRVSGRSNGRSNLDKVWGTYGSAPEEARSFLRKAIRKLTGRSMDIYYWNDAKKRTHKQVLKTFDKAIELAKISKTK